MMNGPPSGTPNVALISFHSPPSKCGLPSNMMARITSVRHPERCVDLVPEERPDVVSGRGPDIALRGVPSRSWSERR